MARFILSDSQFQELKANSPDGEVRKAYTGRGMVGYGEPSKTAIGYVGDYPLAFALELAISAAQLEGAQDIDVDVVRDAIDAIGEPSTDSMGLSTIYYWKNISAANPTADEEDAD